MLYNRYKIGKVYISITNPHDAIIKIEKAVKNNLNTYVCVSNPRTVTYAYKNIDYQHIMDKSFMNIPDAEPMLWAAKLWGLNNVKRTMGPLLFHDMIAKPENGIKHFLLGDTNNTLNKLDNLYRSKYNSIIVGTYSPPFCDINDYDYSNIANRINESDADIVWISLRAPKQDFFAAKILPYLSHKVCIGIGAAFRFNLGEYKMANPVIKKLGLMGLFWGKKDQKYIRFIYNYLCDNIPYVLLCMKIPFFRLIGKKYYE
jgi:N-acetylglucosaminyldiphosphoundecaprenol N-acetyl-beta-D-mannosaminyltransferase